MGDKALKAEALFKEGYNCSQAVLGAFCAELGLDMETAMKLSSSFGGGMGRLREVCGAVTGMFMVAGLALGYSDPAARQEKAEHYELIQKLAATFTEENGSIICRELLGLRAGKDIPMPAERDGKYYKGRPCAELVKYAAGLLEELFENGDNLFD